MIKNIFILSLLLFQFITFAQDNSVSQDQESEIVDSDNSIDFIKKVPIYPGCGGNNNADLKKCLNVRIRDFIKFHFDIDKIYSLNLAPNTYRVDVGFKIDHDGNIVDVRTRGGSIPQVKAEAIRTIRSLPQMTPGENEGKKVGVLYSIPILFKIEPETKKEKRKRLREERKKNK